jgi:hypothetical protein
MSATITDVYYIADSIAAAVKGTDYLPLPGRNKQCVSVVSSGIIKWLGLALGTPWRISDDGQRIEWPELGRSLRIAQLLDWRKATIYCFPWRASDARSEVERDELVGCWKNMGGYALLEPEGCFRQKIVWKGHAQDIPGTWTYVGSQSFQIQLAIPNGLSTHQVAAYDGNTLIMTVEKRVQVKKFDQTFALPVLWTRAKRPKSWATK